MYIRLTWHIVRYPIATKKEYLKPETERIRGLRRAVTQSIFSSSSPSLPTCNPSQSPLCSTANPVPALPSLEHSLPGTLHLLSPGPYNRVTPGALQTADTWASPRYLGFVGTGYTRQVESSAQLELGTPDLEGLALRFSSSQTIVLTPDLCKIWTSVTLPTTPSFEHFVVLASVLVCFLPLWLILPRLLPSFSFSAYSLG